MLFAVVAVVSAVANIGTAATSVLATVSTKALVANALGECMQLPSSIEGFRTGTLALVYCSDKNS